MSTGPKDYYAILGIAPRSSLEEVRRAYRNRVKESHPDAGGPVDGARFRDVREAYEVLSDPVKRHAYDREGTKARAAHPAGAAPPRGRPRGAVMEIVLSPGEAIRGGRLGFEMPVLMDCPSCGGSGDGFFLLCLDCRGEGRRRVYRRLEFLVPPGVQQGALLTARAGLGRGREMAFQGRVRIVQEWAG